MTKSPVRIAFLIFGCICLIVGMFVDNNEAILGLGVVSLILGGVFGILLNFVFGILLGETVGALWRRATGVSRSDGDSGGGDGPGDDDGDIGIGDIGGGGD